MEKKVLVAREFRDSSLRGRITDSHEAIQNKNQSAQSATESRPIRGAKNRNQTSSSASADFLLESDKRGSPPKSEKRQLLARRGSGVGGAALLRKKSSESKRNKIVGDSRITKMDCHESLRDSRNDGFFDSTNRTHNYRFILTRSKF